MVTLFTSMICMVYTITQKPYKNKKDYYIEIFNEACFMTLCYVIIIFTSFVSDEEIKIKAGNFAIIITLTCIAINLIMIFVLNALGVWQYIQRK